MLGKKRISNRSSNSNNYGNNNRQEVQYDTNQRGPRNFRNKNNNYKDHNEIGKYFI